MTTPTPAMLAAADQGISEIGEKLDLLVAFYRDETDSGIDRTELIASMTAALVQQSPAVNVAALFAVALSRLADEDGVR